MPQLRAISTFCGCGGMDHALHQLGMKTVFATDIMADAIDSFKLSFPKVPVETAAIQDIRDFPSADLVVGGYPCQSFSMGGNRNPDGDSRTVLYKEFARCLREVQPKFFIAENVAGLQKLQKGRFLEAQVEEFNASGSVGYVISACVLNAKDYGIPQARKRMFIVGVRRDLGLQYVFPARTHGKPSRSEPWLLPFSSHGDVLAGLPMWPEGEFYERPHDPDGHFSWYYMSRNRKAPWDGPAYTVVANWRHVTLHPASPKMTLTWSDLANGWKQRWDFSEEYEHLAKDPDRPILEEARRLSWRECAAIQTFPKNTEFAGSVQSRFTQIGNAIPPDLGKVVLQPLIDGTGLKPAAAAVSGEKSEKQQLLFA